jgi:LuxR family maltose regulon positive regulatory protein
MAQLLRALLPTIQDKVLRSYARNILRAFAIEYGERFTPNSESAPTADGEVFASLSPQEQRVLRLLADGRTNREIAGELVVSVNTVKDHVKHLYRKLGVGNRVQASEAARHLKLDLRAPRSDP